MTEHLTTLKDFPLRVLNESGGPEHSFRVNGKRDVINPIQEERAGLFEHPASEFASEPVTLQELVATSKQQVFGRVTNRPIESLLVLQSWGQNGAHERFPN